VDETVECMLDRSSCSCASFWVVSLSSSSARTSVPVCIASCLDLAWPCPAHPGAPSGRSPRTICIRPRRCPSFSPPRALAPMAVTTKHGFLTHSCNIFIIVLQRCFIGTQNYVLQIKTVTHSASFTNSVTNIDYSNTKLMLQLKCYKHGILL